MTIGKTLGGKPYAKNQYIQFDAGDVTPCTSEASHRRGCCQRQPECCVSVCAATPRRGVLPYKSLISMCALTALANYAKADNVSAQEHFDMAGKMRSIVVNNPTAQIGTVKTPWMFVRPDGKSGFANNFTTNAISVVSENGIDYYAHIEGKDGDRTKVIHFTIDKNGFPSTHGDVIDVTNSPAVNAEEMKTRKLIGVARGTLCFYPTEDYGTSLLYNPEDNEVFSDRIENLVGSVTQKCLASCQDESTVYVVCNVKCEGYTGTGTYIKRLTGIDAESSRTYPPFPEKNKENRAISYCMAHHKNKFCIGDSEGNVDFISDGTFFREFSQVPFQV